MMNEIDQLFIFGEIINPRNVKGFNSDASPLIRGKKATLDEAIKLIKKKIQKKEVHFSNLSCDLKTIDKVIEVSEKKRFSINHSNQNEINNFYLPFQKFGGSIVSLNELKNRADLLIIIGHIEEDTFKTFLDFLRWDKREISNKIFYVASKGKNNFSNTIIAKDIFSFINGINKINYGNIGEISKRISRSNYPVFILSSSNTLLTNEMVMRRLQSLNQENKNIKISRICGLNNSAGFVNSCVVKSGFPGPLNFTDWGINYEPYELELSKVKKRKEVQFSISNFSKKSFDHKFEINISIGNPSLDDRRVSDIFIPTKTPGIDTDGLVLRSDGSKVIKLPKKFKSNYVESSELVEKIFS
ncbi:MAG: hypothetical protein VW827_01905 [Alphaproteobacteria bacterium]